MKGISLHQKMQIKSLLESGKKYPEIAKELNLNLKLVEKWGLLIKKGKPLVCPMGRPGHGTLSTFDQDIRQQIDQYRPGKKGWGAISIQVEMKLDPNNEGKKIPSVRSINQYLHGKQQTAKRDKRTHLPVVPVYPAESCHDLWQLDAQGNTYVDTVGTVSFLNIKDTFSKTTVQMFPCPLKSRHSHPNAFDYQTVMRLAMMEFGTCKRLQVDHASVYYDNASSSPFPTPFHLWLVGLDIQMCLTPKGQPQKQGMVERSHQTSQTQVLEANQHFLNWFDLFRFCQYRRKRMNYHIPNRGLNNQPPLVAFPQAVHSTRTYQPKEEYAQFSEQAVRDYLKQGKWYRRVSKAKTVSLSNHVYYVSQAKPQEELMITFDAKSSNVVFQRADEELIAQMPVKGLDFKELAGNIDDFITVFGRISPENPYDFSAF